MKSLPLLSSVAISLVICFSLQADPASTSQTQVLTPTQIIAKAQQQIQTSQDAITSLQAQKTPLETQLTTLENQILVYKSKNQTSQLTAAQKQAAVLAAQISGIEDEINDNLTTVTTDKILINKIKFVQAKIATQGETITAKRNALTDAKVALEKLRANLADINNSTAVDDAIQAETASLVASIKSGELDSVNAAFSEQAKAAYTAWMQYKIEDNAYLSLVLQYKDFNDAPEEVQQQAARIKASRQNFATQYSQAIDELDTQVHETMYHESTKAIEKLISEQEAAVTAASTDYTNAQNEKTQLQSVQSKMIALVDGVNELQPIDLDDYGSAILTSTDKALLKAANTYQEQFRSVIAGYVSLLESQTNTDTVASVSQTDLQEQNYLQAIEAIRTVATDITDLKQALKNPPKIGMFETLQVFFKKLKVLFVKLSWNVFKDSTAAEKALAAQTQDLINNTNDILKVLDIDYASLTAQQNSSDALTRAETTYEIQQLNMKINLQDHTVMLQTEISQREQIIQDNIRGNATVLAQLPQEVDDGGWTTEEFQEAAKQLQKQLPALQASYATEKSAFLTNFSSTIDTADKRTAWDQYIAGVAQGSDGAASAAAAREKLQSLGVGLYELLELHSEYDSVNNSLQQLDSMQQDISNLQQVSQIDQLQDALTGTQTLITTVDNGEAISQETVGTQTFSGISDTMMSLIGEYNQVHSNYEAALNPTDPVSTITPINHGTIPPVIPPEPLPPIIPEPEPEPIPEPEPEISLAKALVPHIMRAQPFATSVRELRAQYEPLSL